MPLHSPHCRLAGAGSRKGRMVGRVAGGALACMALARFENERPLPRQPGDNGFLPWRLPRRLVARVEQSSLHMSKSNAQRLRIALFDYFGDMDSTQSCNLFFSPGCKEGNQSIALSRRR